MVIKCIGIRKKLIQQSTLLKHFQRFEIYNIQYVKKRFLHMYRLINMDEHFQVTKEKKNDSTTYSPRN